MRKIPTALWALVALWFCCGAGRAQNQEAWKTLQPALSKLLRDAAGRIEKMDGEDARRARHALTIALAKSGDCTAARALAVRLNDTGYAVNAWSTIGQMQGMMAHDRAAANADFARALEAARRLKAGSSDQHDAYAEVVEAQARGGDVRGALDFAFGLDKQAKPKVLLRLARVAARRGVEGPALELLRVATDEAERSQAHSLRALSLAEREGDTPAARQAFAKVTKPLHKIPVLLALFDHPAGGARGDARLLDEALAAVAQNRPEPGAFGFHDVANDAAMGAIALRQLKAGTDQAGAIKQAAATLRNIKSPENAQKYIEQICEKLAVLDSATAVAISQRLDGEHRIGALCAIARGLGRRLSSQPNEKPPELLRTVEALVNQALDLANKLDEFDRRWAGVPVARAVAAADEFAPAYQVANRIDAANQRAYAFAGVARSAIENRRETRAREALKNLETAALTERQPEVAAQIIAQATLAITQPLLGDEPIDTPSAMAGLE